MCVVAAVVYDKRYNYDFNFFGDVVDIVPIVVVEVSNEGPNFRDE